MADSLGTFGSPYVEKEVRDLLYQSLPKNSADCSSYPITAEVDTRCINMMARLFNAPINSKDDAAVGCSTVGSTEAIILGTLAMKKRWQLDRISKGLPIDKPNFVMGALHHCAYIKATKFFDIEYRIQSSDASCSIDPQKAIDLVDENTIGIGVILGTTYTGHYEDVKMINDLLEEKCKLTNWNIGIHVDAASGGFIAPFATPDLEWDFRLNRVHSINASGHKFGMGIISCGWCIWRSSEYLPRDLIFHDDFSATNNGSATLNFSKPSAFTTSLYYKFLQKGTEQYQKLISRLLDLTEYLSNKLLEAGNLEIISERSRNCIPLVALHLKGKKAYTEFDIAAELRNYGWIIPAYFLPTAPGRISIMRIVVHEDFTVNQADHFTRDINHVIQKLDETHKI
ncbi:glutamate decarboxylase [Backusella circina FSU 941]|nr:glutamate decarboxylase [Backusella circina FSU 941]